VPVQEESVGAEQEGSGPAGGVYESHLGDFRGGLASYQRADCSLDDVVYDECRRVVDAALLLDIRFIGDCDGFAAYCYHFPQHLFVDLTE
jgi:hypothetical protein